MGFLKNFNSNKNSDLHQGWKELNDLEQLDQIIADSKDKPVAVFKHSTTCGISARAKHVLEGNWDIEESELDFYYLDLLTYRPVSNKVAELTGVQHQSPQVVLIKDGKAVYNESHHSISVKELREFL